MCPCGGRRGVCRIPGPRRSLATGHLSFPASNDIPSQLPRDHSTPSASHSLGTHGLCSHGTCRQSQRLPHASARVPWRREKKASKLVLQKLPLASPQTLTLTNPTHFQAPRTHIRDMDQKGLHLNNELAAEPRIPTPHGIGRTLEGRLWPALSSGGGGGGTRMKCVNPGSEKPLTCPPQVSGGRSTYRRALAHSSGICIWADPSPPE